ncbi:hypothetical protein GQ43DRAFT_378440, partial [Delitschia confertaspora ATCC 74209]
WDDTFITDLASTLRACQVFLFYPFCWAAYSQFLKNFISLTATMETHGIPTDSMGNMIPLQVLILLPLLDRAVFPFFRLVLVGFVLYDICTPAPIISRDRST